MAEPSLLDARNLSAAPITSPDYGLALALQTHMASYEYVISQPTVLNEADGRRLLEIMAEGYKPLPAEPLPIQTRRGFWRSLLLVVRGRRLYA